VRDLVGGETLGEHLTERSVQLSLCFGGLARGLFGGEPHDRIAIERRAQLSLLGGETAGRNPAGEIVADRSAQLRRWPSGGRSILNTVSEFPLCLGIGLGGPTGSPF
jgi:hypothetical protein